MISRILMLAVAIWLYGSAGALAFDFGSVPVGSSASLSEGGSNDTDNTATVSVAIGGPNAGDFSVVLSCGGSMPPMTSCTGTVTFRPSSPGPKDATLTVNVVILDFADSFDIPLSGVGVASSTNLAEFDPHAGVPTTLPPVVQSVTPSGGATDLALSAQMRFDPSIAGQQGSIFVGARVPPYATGSGLTGSSQPQNATQLRQASESSTETWYVSNGSTWGQLGATIPSVFTGTLNDANAMVNILNGVNTAGLCGTEFYVGYGTNSSAMLANNTLGKVYTVVCNFDFTATASGNLSALSLTANAQVATADAGKNGNFYVGRLLNSQWTLHNGNAWVAYSGGAIPVYSSGVLSSRQIQVLSNENVQALVGAQIFVGYGLNESDLLSNGKYEAVHTIQ